MKIEILLFKPVFIRAGRDFIALSRPVQSDFRIKIEEEGEVRSYPECCELIDLLNQGEGEPSSEALVGDRCIAEAVTQDNASVIDGRANDLRDMLSPCRSV